MTPMVAAARHANSPAGLRRAVLLLAILISGGMTVFPREPILLIIVVLCLVITRFRLPQRRRFWPLLILLGALLLGTVARPGPVNIPSLAGRFTHYLAAMLMLQVYLQAPAGALAGDLRALLRPMAFQALGTVLLAHTVGGLFATVTFDDQDYLTLFGLFNYHVTIEEIGSGIIRPDGFFFEPGVFQIYLNLYLYLELFVFRRHGRAGVALLAALSTQSTTGVVITTLLLGAALAQHVARGSSRSRVLALGLALALAPPVLYLAYENINEKLFGVSQGSSWAREYDLYTGLNVVAEYPLLGIGFEVERYFEASSRLGFADTPLASQLLEDRPTSNGVVQLLYAVGIPLALPFLCGMFRQRLFSHPVLIGAWLLLSLSGEVLMFTPFFLFIVFSAFLVRPVVRPARVPAT